MNNASFALALALALLLVAGAAHAQFKCVAADGAVTLQQTPCPTGATQTAVGPKPAAPQRRPTPERIAVGMRLHEVLEAMPDVPFKMNTTETAAGTYDQMVYEYPGRKLYVYLSNGVVTAIQR